MDCAGKVRGKSNENMVIIGDRSAEERAELSAEERDGTSLSESTVPTTSAVTLSGNQQPIRTEITEAAMELGSEGTTGRFWASWEQNPNYYGVYGQDVYTEPQSVEETNLDDFGSDVFAIPEVVPIHSRNPVVDRSACKADEDDNIKAFF